jgi:hypothetical protein
MSTTILYGDEKLAVNVETIAAAKTLTASDSGKYFTLNAAAGAQITLPSVAIAGFKARFTVGAAFATTNWTIKAATNVIQGSADVNSTLVPGANENTISFVATAETIGDYIEIYSDGTNFYAYGIGAAAGAITFTAP